MARMTSRKALCGLAVACGLSAAPAFSGIYWNNGPVVASGGYCDNSPTPDLTTGCTAGFTIYDDFTAHPGVAINSITYATYLSGSVPTQARFVFYDHDPATDASDPVLDFVDPVVTSAGPNGATLVTLGAISILLPAGHYWLGLQDVFTDGSYSAFGATWEHHLQGAEQGKDGGSIYTIGSFDAAFVLGTDVPEPASWALMIVGVGLVGASLRRSRAMASAEGAVGGG